MRVASTMLAVGTLLAADEAAAFDFDNVVARAKALAQQPYRAPAEIPESLRGLSYAVHRAIQSAPRKSLWRTDRSRLQVQFVMPGPDNRYPVDINVVDGDVVQKIPFSKDYFVIPWASVAKRIPDDVGFGGFRLSYAFPKRHGQSQFMAFAGASYYRAIGEHDNFGSSARGIAIDTGLAPVEEFPRFAEYWLVRPAPDATSMDIYALMDGDSLTGAYKFTVKPDVTTTVEVRAVLFTRKSVRRLGVAPLTSMFYYGSNTPRPLGEWRRQVHDSDGLLIREGSTGEWLFRPVMNPTQLEVDSFQTTNLLGFGLMQRQRSFLAYEDYEARYDRRPNVWVTPGGDWGPGRVFLVELTANSENMDNIVAFWSPKDTVPGGRRLEYSYVTSFGGEDVTGEPLGRAIQTLVGRGDRIGGGNIARGYLVLVDFEGGMIDHLTKRPVVVAHVTGDADTKIFAYGVRWLHPVARFRVSIFVRPARGKPLSLRAYLTQADKTITETWTYRLPWKNRFR